MVLSAKGVGDEEVLYTRIALPYLALSEATFGMPASQNTVTGFSTGALGRSVCTTAACTKKTQQKITKQTKEAE